TPRLPPAERVLVVAGSLHATTVAQVAALARAGWARLDHPLEGLDPSLTGRLAEALGRHPRVVLSFAPRGLTPERVLHLGAQPGVSDRLLGPLAGTVQAAAPGPGLAFVLTGGETAWRVCRALGGRQIELTGEALPGVPLGVLRLPQGDFAVATKSGGFGGPDALLRTVAALTGGPPAAGAPPPPPGARPGGRRGGPSRRR